MALTCDYFKTADQPRKQGQNSRGGTQFCLGTHDIHINYFEVLRREACQSYGVDSSDSKTDHECTDSTLNKNRAMSIQHHE